MIGLEEFRLRSILEKVSTSTDFSDKRNDDCGRIQKNQKGSP